MERKLRAIVDQEYHGSIATGEPFLDYLEDTVVNRLRAPSVRVFGRETAYFKEYTYSISALQKVGLVLDHFAGLVLDSVVESPHSYMHQTFQIMDIDFDDRLHLLYYNKSKEHAYEGKSVCDILSLTYFGTLFMERCGTPQRRKQASISIS